MEGASECPVVPIGGMPIGNALNSHPRRRVPPGGTKLNKKEEERKKPSLKDLFGVTPLDILGSVSTDHLPTPVKLIQRIVGNSNTGITDTQPEKQQPQEPKTQGVEQSCWQHHHGFGQPVPSAHQQPLEDTRTNLEKYMGMKMQGSMCQVHPCHMSGPVPAYAPTPYISQSQRPGFCFPPSFTGPTSLSPGVQGCCNSQGITSQYDSQYGFDGTANYRQESRGDASSCIGLPVDQQNAFRQSDVPERLQFETPPTWFQHKSYLPQVPQYSHMTAPVPGTPFHPGFSYATDFKYYYNYYSADQYAGEIDGGDATAQEEAVAREQHHAEELVSRQVTQAEASVTKLTPIITSKKRLESGKAVAM